MKKLLSLLLIMAMLSSVSVFAVTEIEYTFKGEDGYVYHFGAFDETDEDAGLVINGKKYSLTGGTHTCATVGCENAFAHAQNNNQKFGMGIKLENGEDSYTMAPYATVAGNDNVAEVPETVTVATVEAFPEAEEEDDVYERGTFTLATAYRINRTVGGVFDSWAAENQQTQAKARMRYLNTDGTYHSREYGLLKFNTTAEGLNADDEVILTVQIRAANDADLGVGGSIRIIGVDGENYVYNTTYPVYDENYIFNPEEPVPTLTKTHQNFEFNVTRYVKNKLSNGNEQISFLIEPVASDNVCTMYFNGTTAKIEYK